MELVNTFRGFFGGLAKLIENNKADILHNIGIASGGAAIILTAYETPKAIEDWRNAKKEAAKVYLTEPDDKTAFKKSADIRLKGILKTAADYGPAALCYGVSTYSYSRAFNIVKSEKADALLIAAGLAKLYDSYEKRVAGKIGEEEERKLRIESKKEKIDIFEIQEDGSEKKVKKTVNMLDENYDISAFNKTEPYQRWFTPDTSSKYIETSKFGLRNMNTELFQSAETIGTIHLKYSNDGVLPLDDVLDELGIYDKTKYSARAAWSYDEDNPHGDNCVKIKWTEYYQARRYFDDIEQEMCTKYIPIYLLEFNIDGDIYEMMKRPEK